MSDSKPIEPSDHDAERESVKQAVLDVIRSLGDGAGPADVLQVARDPLSVLHPYFVWDDSEAAEKYRTIQAGVLLRRVRYQIVRVDQDTKQVSIKSIRATTSVPDQRTKSNSRSYGPTDEVMKDDKKRASVLSGIVRELVALRNKYRTYSELHDVWVVIDDAALMFDPPSTKRSKGSDKSAPPPVA